MSALPVTNVRAFLKTYGIEYATEGALTVGEQEQYMAIAQLYHEVPTIVAYLGLGNTNLLPAKFLEAINASAEPVDPEEPEEPVDPEEPEVPTLVSITIEPNPIEVEVDGDPVPFTAIGTYSDESTAPLDTSEAIIENEEVAIVDSSTVLGLTEGETVITITNGEVIGTATIIVTSAV